MVRARPASSRSSSRAIRACRRPSSRRSSTRSKQRGLALALYSLRHPTDRETHPIHDEIRAPVAYLPEYLHDEPVRVWRGWRRARRLPGLPRRASPHGGATSARDPTRNRIRRFGQALVLAAEMPGDVVAPARALPAHAGVGRRATRRCCAACPGAARRTPRTSGRRPSGRSAKSSTPARGSRPAPRSTRVICASSRARAERSTSTTTASTRGAFRRRLRAPCATATARDAASPGPDPRGGPRRRQERLRRPARSARADSARPALAVHAHRRRSAAARARGRGAPRSASPSASSGAARKRKPPCSTPIAPRTSSRCRAGVSADGDRDGLPNVLLEAQSQKLPCVSTRVSGIPELIEHDVTGLLVEPRAIARARGSAVAPDRRPGAAAPPRRRRLRAGDARVLDGRRRRPARGPLCGPPRRRHESRVLRADEAGGSSGAVGRPAAGAGAAAGAARRGPRRLRRVAASGASTAAATRRAGAARRCSGTAWRAARPPPTASGDAARRLVHVSPVSQGARLARAGREPRARHSLRRRRGVGRGETATRHSGRWVTRASVAADRGRRGDDLLQSGRCSPVFALCAARRARTSACRRSSTSTRLPLLPPHRLPRRARPRGQACGSITVAMMRPGAKLASYRLLADALARVALPGLGARHRGRRPGARGRRGGLCALRADRRFDWSAFQDARAAWPRGCAPATSSSGRRSTRRSAWRSSKRRPAACPSSPATAVASRAWWRRVARGCWSRWATPPRLPRRSLRLLTETAVAAADGEPKPSPMRNREHDLPAAAARLDAVLRRVARGALVGRAPTRLRPRAAR